MNKNIVILIIIGAVGVGSYFVYQSQSQNTTLSETRVSNQPERPAEINGVIVGAQGNELTIANEINRPTLTDEEKEANKEARQNLTQEERAALRKEEQEAFETENITVIIPVGIPIISGTGEATGETVKVDIASLIKGTYISAWETPEKQIEYVKIKGSN